MARVANDKDAAILLVTVNAISTVPHHFSNSPPSLLQTARRSQDKAELWTVTRVVKGASGKCQNCPGGAAAVERCRARRISAPPRGSAWWEWGKRRSPSRHISPGRLQSWTSLRAKRLAWIKPSCIALTAVVIKTLDGQSINTEVFFFKSRAVSSFESLGRDQAKDVQLHPGGWRRAHVSWRSGVPASPHHQQDATILQKACGQRGGYHEAKGKTWPLSHHGVYVKFSSFTKIIPFLCTFCECWNAIQNSVCWHAVGHGRPPDIVEGGSGPGLSGHNTRNVDPPERVAALWCSDVTWAGCFCLVKIHKFTKNDFGENLRKIPPPKKPISNKM